MGWWYKTGFYGIDVMFSSKECRIGVHDYLVDDGDWNCFTGTYFVDIVKFWITENWTAYRNGMYDWGYNTCQDYKPAFAQRKAVAASFQD